MGTMRFWALVMACLAPAVALAQSATATKAEAPLQPGLLALAEPRIAELRAVGITQIIGRTTGRSNVQVLSKYGAAYVRWPKNITPVAFELYINDDGTNAAFANDFSDATKPKFAAALDAVVPQAVRAAANARAAALRPKP